MSRRADANARRSRISRRFGSAVIATIRDSKVLRIRAGVEPHRFIGIWAVVVNGKVFVRSWNDKPDGWCRVFLKDPRGAVHIAEREIRVRARRRRGARLMEAIELAYKEKYNTPGSRKFVRGFAGARRRMTTTELVPV